jgi:hypothetical protein
MTLRHLLPKLLGINKPKPEITAIIPTENIPPGVGPDANVIQTPRRQDKQTLNELTPDTPNPFTNAVTGLSSTPLNHGWRTMLCEGQTLVFKGIAVLEKDSEVRIDILLGSRHEKLGYLGAATTHNRACTKVNIDSEMGCAID